MSNKPGFRPANKSLSKLADLSRPSSSCMSKRDNNTHVVQWSRDVKNTVSGTYWPSIHTSFTIPKTANLVWDDMLSSAKQFLP